MGMLGYLFQLCRTPLRLHLEESMKRRQSEGIMWQTKGRKQVRYVCVVAQLVFHVEKESRIFVSIPETGDPYNFLDEVSLFKPRSQKALTAVLTDTNHEQDHSGLLA